MKILLEGNSCVGIDTKEHEVHPSLTWMDYNGPTPHIGDTWNGTAFVPKPPPTAEEMSAIKANEMDSVFGDRAIIKLLYSLGNAQGMFNSLEEMRAWVDTKEDPPKTATQGGGPKP